MKVKNFEHIREPYGTHWIDGEWTPYTLEDIKDHWPRYEKQRMEYMVKCGYGLLEGIVTKGSTTSRLFQHTSTDDDTGKHVTVNVRKTDIEVGWKRDIAM